MQTQKECVLVTGANGQLGKCLQDASHLFSNLQFHFMGREHLPINDFRLVEQVCNTLRPTVIINAAAYTAVDKAEQEQELANLMNGYAVENLAVCAKHLNAKFLHVSTDYVFDGTAILPYTESHTTNPVNAYGGSKLLGEQLAIAVNPQTFVVRTSWVYSRFGNNFVKTMLRLMAERTTLNVVADQHGCPTFAVDLSEALLTIAFHQNEDGGIYHFSNQQPTTWFDFASEISAYKGFSCSVQPIPTEAYPTPAKRPAYSVMDCHKIFETFAIPPLNWIDRLHACLDSWDA